MAQHFIDGQFIEYEDVSISIDDRGYYFGDGVYEVVKIYEGKLFTAAEHFERLFKSAAEIRLNIPYTKEALIEVAHQLMERNQIQNGHIYLQVTRGVEARQHHFPNDSVKPVVTAYATATSRPVQHMKTGLKVKTVADIRWLRCDIKSLNLLGSILAKQEAYDAGAAEAMLHRDGIVTEGSSTNMFGVKDGVIYTHPANHLILNGITRQVVIGLCESLGLQVKEEAFTVDEAYAMDEMFFTSTNVEVMPIISIDEKTIGDGRKGPLTIALQKAFYAALPLSMNHEQ